MINNVFFCYLYWRRNENWDWLKYTYILYLMIACTHNYIYITERCLNICLFRFYVCAKLFLLNFSEKNLANILQTSCLTFFLSKKCIFFVLKGWYWLVRRAQRWSRFRLQRIFQFRETGTRWNLCNGQKDTVEANERNSDATSRIRVHSDGRLCRGCHTKGINSSYCQLLYLLMENLLRIPLKVGQYATVLFRFIQRAFRLKRRSNTLNYANLTS